MKKEKKRKEKLSERGRAGEERRKKEDQGLLHRPGWRRVFLGN